MDMVFRPEGIEERNGCLQRQKRYVDSQYFQAVQRTEEADPAHVTTVSKHLSWKIMSSIERSDHTAKGKSGSNKESLMDVEL